MQAVPWLLVSPRRSLCFLLPWLWHPPGPVTFHTGSLCSGGVGEQSWAPGPQSSDCSSGWCCPFLTALQGLKAFLVLPTSCGMRWEQISRGEQGMWGKGLFLLGGGGGNDLGHPGQGRSELGHRLHEDRAVARGTPFPRSSGSPSSSSPAPPAWPLCSFSAVLVIKDMMMFLCSQSAVGCVGWSAALAGGWVPSTHSPGAALMGEL